MEATKTRSRIDLVRNTGGGILLLDPAIALSDLRRLGENSKKGGLKAEDAVVDTFMKYFSDISESTFAIDSGRMFHLMDAAAVRVNRTVVIGTAKTPQGDVRGILSRVETSVFSTYNHYSNSNLSIGFEMLDKDGEPERRIKNGFDLVSMLFGQNTENELRRHKAQKINRIASRHHDAFIEIGERGVTAMVIDARLKDFVNAVKTDLENSVAIKDA